MITVSIHDPFALPKFDDSWKRECRTCAHLDSWVAGTEGPHAGGAHTIMQCRRSHAEFGRQVACIDARAEDGECGPDARRWERA